MSNFSVEIVSWVDKEAVLVAIRDKVFIEEQSVPEELERDPQDQDYVHALAISNQGEAMGTGRLLPGGKIGRMAVLGAWRGHGVGAALLEALVEFARERGDREVMLDAQTTAEAFYQRHGFISEGDIFMDAGIPHIRMRRSLKPQS